jgi:hypothetical protein
LSLIARLLSAARGVVFSGVFAQQSREQPHRSQPGFSRITLNGSETLSPIVFTRGKRYRLRVINIAPNLGANFQLGSQEHPATWLALAKDGATFPARMAKPQDAVLHIVSGETYDFEFHPETPGEIPLQIENSLNQAKLTGKIVVQ